MADASANVRATSEIEALWAPTRLLVVALVCLGVGIAHAMDADDNPAASLRAKYGALQDQLSHNQFQRPLYLDSSETSSSVTGDIYALINYPFATADAALNDPARWCDILMLHVNTKFCRAATDSRGSVLQINIGKKYDQPLDDAYPVDFAYRVAAKTSNYLQVKLNADEGPLSTRNYLILLEAIPLENERTFIHLSYSYAYGMLGRLAMLAYLGTIGRGKVGFTIVGKQSDRPPLYIGGMRGLVERNTMRYYLAIEAYLGALSAPPQARFERSLRDWFSAIERYPRQLHEMEEGDYVAMKRKELLRQQTGARATARPAPGA